MSDSLKWGLEYNSGGLSIPKVIFSFGGTKLKYCINTIKSRWFIVRRNSVPDFLIDSLVFDLTVLSGHDTRISTGFNFMHSTSLSADFEQ